MKRRTPEWNATSAFTDISTSLQERIRGWKSSSCRTQPIPTTTGTSGFPRSATPRTPPRGFWMTRTASNPLPITTRRSASTSALRCFPGWRVLPPRSIRPFSMPTAKASRGSPARVRLLRRHTTIRSCPFPTGAISTRRPFGAFATSSTASGGLPRECGSRKPP